MSRVGDALVQIDFARQYTLARVEAVDLAEWYSIPAGGVSHLAWQIGHIAMAEYRICLERLRPRTPTDERLIPDDFLKTFGRESAPAAVIGYSADEIRAVFDAVHTQVLTELPDYPDTDLDLPPLKPHPLFQTRMTGLIYAPLHEMIHCGQIALLRRMLGYPPFW
jgi:hypothetical protein